MASSGVAGEHDDDGIPKLVLLDREQERGVLDELLSQVDAGAGSTCVLRGEPGMGKSRLLRYAIESTPQLRNVWISGAPAEKDLGYAGLHRLLRPFLERSGDLPAPQRDALEFAFGLQVDRPADRFMVGLACLTLLAEVATERGLVCVIDDAQWIDEESLHVLAFVARRLAADRIALLFGLRHGFSDPAQILGGFRIIEVEGLPDGPALELLSTQAEVNVDSDVARRIVVATSGCPLALLELASDLSDDQLRGGRFLSEPLPVGRRLEDHFLRQVRALPENAQMFLLAVAAETSGDASLVRRVAVELGANADAEDVARESGLLLWGDDLEFRHPLIRSAVYAGAPLGLRRSVHTAFADAIDRATDPDRRAQHLAAAALGPDEVLAAELEDAAERASRRGGNSAESAFLLQAAQLTPDPGRAAARTLRAAGAALHAGLPSRAEALLDQAKPRLEDPLLRAQAMRLDGRVQVPLAKPASSAARLLAAARAFEPLDRAQARDCLLQALDSCFVSQRFTESTSAEEVAAVALAMPRDDGPRTLADFLLDGTALWITKRYAEAEPLLLEATERLSDPDLARDDVARWFSFGLCMANERWDDAFFGRWAHRVERDARNQGALTALQVALLGLATTEVRAGRFTAAEAHYDDAVEIARAIGVYADFYAMLKLEVHAWRGDEAAAIEAARVVAELATAIGSGAALAVAQLGLGVLWLGRGRYAEALESIRPILDGDLPGWACLALFIGVEAGLRSGDVATARDCLERLENKVTVSATPWGLGVLARCRAVLAADDEAEQLFVASIRFLERTTVRTDIAHTHLLYGEWLRRQNRRRDARVELRLAYDAFWAMGADGFAHRASTELAATGEHARRRSVETLTNLTPQESQIARLAADGLTNPEIAAQLFISSSTVDYHLRKVYRKLGIQSRRQLLTADVRDQFAQVGPA